MRILHVHVAEIVYSLLPSPGFVKQNFSTSSSFLSPTKVETTYSTSCLKTLGTTLACTHTGSGTAVVKLFSSLCSNQMWSLSRLAHSLQGHPLHCKHLFPTNPTAPDEFCNSLPWPLRNSPCRTLSSRLSSYNLSQRTLFALITSLLKRETPYPILTLLRDRASAHDTGHQGLHLPFALQGHQCPFSKR